MMAPSLCRTLVRWSPAAAALDATVAAAALRDAAATAILCLTTLTFAVVALVVSSRS